MAYGAPAVRGPGTPTARPGGVNQTMVRQGPQFNQGGYRGTTPVNLAQAYGNQGGTLPQYQYGKGPGGAGQWGYKGTTPVDMGQAYQNMQPKPTAPPAQTGGSSGQASTPDYLTAAQSDPQYLAQTAANAFKVNSQIGQLQQTLGFDETNLQAALAKLAYQQPRDALNLEQKGNARGSLYSSYLGQQEGNLAYQYAGKQGGLNENFARTKAGITSKVGSLQNSIPLYNANALAQAIARAKLPTGPAAPAPGTQPGTTPGSLPSKPGKFDKTGGKGKGYGRGRPAVNLAQAYGNQGGTLPGYQYGKGPGGAGQWGYVGKGPVNMAQAYQNLLAQKGKK